MITFTLQSRNSELKLTKTYSVSHVCVVAVHLKKSYYVCVRDACMHTKSCKGNILRMLSRLAWGVKIILKGFILIFLSSMVSRDFKICQYVLKSRITISSKKELL